LLLCYCLCMDRPQTRSVTSCSSVCARAPLRQLPVRQ
jgi:hypothetical protein